MARKQQQLLTHAKPTHVSPEPSLFSSHSPLDYRGFHNLVMLLLFVANLRLMVENFLKYGILFDIKQTLLKGWLEGDSGRDILYCVFTCACVIPASCCVCLALEHFRKRRDLTVKQLNLSFLVHLINLLFMVVFSNFIAYKFIDHPLLASAPCFLSMISLLKLISFISVNAELKFYQRDTADSDDDTFMDDSFVVTKKSGSAVKRRKNAQTSTGSKSSSSEPNSPIDDSKCLSSVYGADVEFPKNLKLSNFLYFLLAPTLCYQPAYPRTERFRKFFFTKRLLETITLSLAMYFLAEQYSRPILRNSMIPLNELNGLAVMERILKLSIPSVYIWLMMFFLVFHSYLNLWAEILRFGDRSFYRPWWNATTIAEYWRLWNLPVYRWFKRHVYSPLIARGYPKWLGSIVAFFISAIGHEVLVGIPVKVFEGWAFGAMMSQIPLIWLTEIIKAWETKQALREHHKHQVNKHPDDGQSNLDNNMIWKDNDSVASPESESLSEDRKHLLNSYAKSQPSRSKSGMMGNYVFWLSFCILGQPLGVLMYYRSWYIRNHPELFNE
jgi:diacylglycerol O-acyltransferase-1